MVANPTIGREGKVEKENAAAERVSVLGWETIAARAPHQGDMAAKLRARKKIECM